MELCLGSFPFNVGFLGSTAHLPKIVWLSCLGILGGWPFSNLHFSIPIYLSFLRSSSTCPTCTLCTPCSSSLLIWSFSFWLFSGCGGGGISFFAFSFSLMSLFSSFSFSLLCVCWLPM